MPPSARTRCSAWWQRHRATRAAKGCPADLSFAVLVRQGVPGAVDDAAAALAGAPSAPGDEDELSMLFSTAACPVGPAGDGDAVLVTANTPAPASSPTSASPALHRRAPPGSLPRRSTAPRGPVPVDGPP